MDNYHYGPFTKFDPNAILEIKANTEDTSQKIYQRFRGTLHLKSQLASDGLYIRVIQCEHIQSLHFRKKCNSYVKISVVSVSGRHTKCCTQIIKKSNSPIYDEKLLVELSEKDSNKRLLISVWNESSEKGSDELLGCTSFGITNLFNNSKAIDGWYYLLGDDIGVERHMKVSNIHSIKTLTKKEPIPPPPTVKEVQYKKHKIIIRRGKQGFGFSLVGERPVLVSKVVLGSPAFDAQLIIEDELVRINGENVTNSSSHIVAKIVKHSKTAIQLEVKRQIDSNNISNLNDFIESNTDSNTLDQDTFNQDNMKKKQFSILCGFCDFSL